MKTPKALRLLLTTLILVVLTLSLTSAFQYYYPSHDYGYRNSYGDYNKRYTTVYDREISVNYYPGGSEKTTYFSRTSTTRYEYPRYEYNYPRRYSNTYYRPYHGAPTYKYSYPSSYRYNNRYYDYHDYDRYRSPYNYNTRYYRY